MHAVPDHLLFPVGHTMSKGAILLVENMAERRLGGTL